MSGSISPRAHRTLHGILAFSLVVSLSFVGFPAAAFAQTTEIDKTGWMKPIKSYDGTNRNYLAHGCGTSTAYGDGKKLVHLGSDYGGSVGTDVFAVGAGTAVYLGAPKTQNEVVIVRHKAANGKTFTAVYGHIRATSKFGTTAGAKSVSVTAGEKIGTLVSHSGGAHLHFGIWEDATARTDRWGTRDCASGEPPLKAANNQKFRAPASFLKDNPAKASTDTRKTVTVDEPTRYGASKWWTQRTKTSSGYDNDYWLTLSAGKKYTNDVVYAIWQSPAALSGKYEVQCHVPTKEAIAYAKYRVGHKDGTKVVVRHQKVIYGWTSLGTYTFNARGSIRLGDATGYDDYNQYLGFDACRWIPR